MRIYRDQGFVIIEDIAAYSFNQLHVELIGNSIRITQLGSNRGEIRTHFSTITDGFGNAIGETPQDVFDYLESVLYEPTAGSGAASKLVTLNFTPPAASQYTLALLDDEAIAGTSYNFTPLPNGGEIEWNCLVAYGYAHIDGMIDVYVHAPTGLLIGEYEFRYKVA